MVRIDSRGVHDEGSRRGFTTGFTTRVHDGGSRRGFTTRVHTKVHDGGSRRGFTGSDTVRAERAGWLGATSELRDGGSLKNGLVAGPSSPARFRLRRPADPVAQPIGRGRADQPSRRRVVSARRGEVVFPRSEAGAPRRPARSAGRTDDHDEGSRRGFTTRVHDGVHTGVHDGGSDEGSPRRHGPSRASRLARGDLVYCQDCACGGCGKREAFSKEAVACVLCVHGSGSVHIASSHFGHPGGSAWDDLRHERLSETCAPFRMTDDSRPMGSCAPSANTRETGSSARSDERAGVSRGYEWYVGVDWGGAEHVIVLLDAAGRKHGTWSVPHTAAAVHHSWPRSSNKLAGRRWGSA